MAAINTFNIGSDCQVSIVAGGAIVASTIMTHFNAKQLTKLLESEGINGIQLYRHVEVGWDLEARYDRADGVLDAFFAAKELARLNGQAPPTIVLTETTQNPDGSVSQLVHGNVTLKFDDIGDRQGDAKVEERISGRSSWRLPPGQLPTAA